MCRSEAKRIAPRAWAPVSVSVCVCVCVCTRPGHYRHRVTAVPHPSDQSRLALRSLSHSISLHLGLPFSAISLFFDFFLVLLFLFFPSFFKIFFSLFNLSSPTSKHTLCYFIQTYLSLPFLFCFPSLKSKQT